MTCSCDDTCPTSASVCLPRANGVILIFEEKDLIDISGASEIIVLITDELGGEVRVTKRLSLGEVQVSTNGYQFSTIITDADSAALVRTLNYLEVQLTQASGLTRTVVTGTIRSPQTMAKDL